MQSGMSRKECGLSAVENYSGQLSPSQRERDENSF